MMFIDHIRHEILSPKPYTVTRTILHKPKNNHRIDGNIINEKLLKAQIYSMSKWLYSAHLSVNERCSDKVTKYMYIMKTPKYVNYDVSLQFLWIKLLSPHLFKSMFNCIKIMCILQSLYKVPG